MAEPGSSSTATIRGRFDQPATGLSTSETRGARGGATRRPSPGAGFAHATLSRGAEEGSPLRPCTRQSRLSLSCPWRGRRIGRPFFGRRLPRLHLLPNVRASPGRESPVAPMQKGIVHPPECLRAPRDGLERRVDVAQKSSIEDRWLAIHAGEGKPRRKKIYCERCRYDDETRCHLSPIA